MILVIVSLFRHWSFKEGLDGTKKRDGPGVERVVRGGRELNGGGIIPNDFPSRARGQGENLTPLDGRAGGVGVYPAWTGSVGGDRSLKYQV